MRTHLLFLCFTLLAGCAHTPSDEERRVREQERRDLDVMKERIGRLERRLSDVDTKLTLLIEREARAPDPAGSDAQRSGARVQAGEMRERVSSADAAESLLNPTNTSGRIDQGRSVDIGRPLADASPQPLESSVMTDDVHSADVADVDANAAPILIDANALRSYEARSGRSSGTLSASSPGQVSSKDRPTPSSTSAPSKSASNRASIGAQKDAPNKSSDVSTHVNAKGPMPHATTPSGDVVVPDGNAKIAYDWSMARLKAGKCEDALQGFRVIEHRFARHHLADNAHYWSAVCFQRMGQFDRAFKMFEEVPVRYPKSNKLADALFGLAEIHEARGARGEAVDTYRTLIARFPDAERADDAGRALDRLSRNSEGAP